MIVTRYVYQLRIVRVLTLLIQQLNRLLIQVFRQPFVDFAVPVSTVFALHDPVICIRKDNQSTRNLQTLQYRPVLERLIQRNAKILLAYRQQNRCAELLSEPNRILLAPDLAAFPDGTAHAQFTMINGVAGTPLRLEIDQTGMADQAFVARRARLHPVGQVTAVTRAARRLPVRIDEMDTA